MRANVYIRKENEIFWDSLEDKSGKINAWLESLQAPKMQRNAEYSTKTREVTNLPSTPSTKKFEFCKHDSVKGLCKQGCA